MGRTDREGGTGGNVVDLFTARASTKIPAQRIDDAATNLLDSLRGSIREDGVVATILGHIERLLRALPARGDTSEETLALAVALDELDDQIATPPTDRDELATLHASLADARTRHTTDADHIEALERDLANERAARKSAEQSRREEASRALAALREEHADVAHATAALAALATKTDRAHAAIGDVLSAVAATAQASISPNLAQQHASLSARLRVLEGWIRDFDERLQDVAEELGAVPDDVARLEAIGRTDRDAASARTDLADLQRRRVLLEAHSEELIARKKPAEEERNRIRELLRAIELVAQPAPEKTTLGEIPDYPTMPDDPETMQPSDANDDRNSGHGSGDSDVSLRSMRLAFVLYDIVRQHIGREPRTLLWVAKSAEAIKLLERHRLQFWTFSKTILSEEHKDLCNKFLHFRGIPGGSANKSNALFSRTEEPIPAEWRVLITDEERSAFITAFRRRIDERAAKRAEKSGGS